MKKYTTLIILVAIIISSFAITTFAVEEERVGDNVYLVTIQTKRITGCAPQTESVTFDTISDIHEHIDYTAIGCFLCTPNSFNDNLSEFPGLNPDGVYADMYFPWDCWTLHKKGHGHALFDVIIVD